MQFLAFFALLVSAMVSGQAVWTQQYIDTLWAQAGAQVTASASPSPSASPTPSPYAVVPPTIPLAPYDPGGTPQPVATTSPVAYTSPAVPASSIPPASSWTPSAQASPALQSTPSAVAYVPSPPLWTPAPGQMLPLYSARFTEPNNPFHTTVAQLVAQGAVLQPQTIVNNFFAQGIGGGSSGDPLYTGLPIYTGTASDPTYTISCTYFSASGCDAQGKQVHIPNGAIVQPKFDEHFTVSDISEQVEFDGWKCQPPANGHLSCYWGGWYPFAGKGLSDSGSDGVHGGYAIGLSTVVAGDVLAGHINHALSITTSCLSNPTIYPADTATGSDSICGQGQSAQYASTNQPHYGSLIHLKWSPTEIASRGLSHGCTIVLNALSEYGGYTTDTDAYWGFSINAENDGVYGAGRNPWQALSAIGEFSSSGATWTQCLSGLTPNDIEILSVPNLGY
jgi:hypothetical protein